MIAMAQNWWASAELPAKFWFYAVKHAAKVWNYFPLKLSDGTWTTPFELANKVEPDLRVLFKLFALAAVCHERVGDFTLGKFESQSLLMIAMGRCPNSHGLQFYNPANSTFISLIDFKIQTHTTSGSYFGLKYQSGIFICRLDDLHQYLHRDLHWILECMVIYICLHQLLKLLVFLYMIILTSIRWYLKMDQFLGTLMILWVKFQNAVTLQLSHYHLHG